MKSKSFIPELLTFVEFTHQYQKVERTILATGLSRNENDAEHSFQMAMVCWFLISTRKLNLSVSKVIEYCLAHDLVEVFAGDTYFYTTDKKVRDSKAIREELARKKILKKFTNFRHMNRVILNYEKKVDEESKFVYAIDKILPVLNIYLDKGKSWKRDKVTYEMIRTKDEKVKISRVPEKLWFEFVENFLSKHKKYFYEK